MKEYTTVGFNPETLARLLGIGLDADLDPGQGSPEQVTAELLEAHLANPPSIDLIDSDGSHLTSLPSFAATTPLGILLTDPQSSSELVGTIGRNAKRMAKCRSSEPERALMTTVYFSAIAHIVAFHGDKPTMHSYESLKASFAELSAKPWMPRELIGLFRQAMEVCQKRE